MRLGVHRASRALYLPLLDLLVDILAVLADGVQRDDHHVVCADLWSSRGRSRLRQVDGEVWDHQWASNVVTLQLGRSLDLLVMVLGLLVELI